MTPVELSREADADLDDILDYGIAAHGRERAETYLRTLAQGLDMIGDYPRLGRARNELRLELRDLPIAQHHIFYRFDCEPVLVARVLDKAMDPVRHL